MEQLGPLLGYYGFLFSMLGAGIFFYYYMKFRKGKKKN